MYLPLLVDDGHRVAVGAHFAGAGDVVLGVGVAEDPVVQGVIAGQIGVGGVDPFHDEIPEGGAAGDCQGLADGLAHSLAVVGVAEQLVVQVGLDGGVGGLEGKAAGGDGVLQAHAEPEVEAAAVVGNAGRAVFAGHQGRGDLEVGFGGGVVG